MSNYPHDMAYYSWHPDSPFYSPSTWDKRSCMECIHKTAQHKCRLSGYEVWEDSPICEDYKRR